METFPSYAVLLFPGYGQKRDPAVTRTEMESGPPKQLKKQSRVLVKISASAWLKSKANFASFIEWHRTNINLGADWFTFTDPLDSVAKTGRIVGGAIESEEPAEADLNNWTVRFMLETWSG